MGNPPTFSFFEVIILIGISQGFIVAGLIWLYKRRQLSKVLLSGILLVFNLLCVKILIHTTGFWHTPYLRYFPLGVELLIQPLIWLYINSLVDGRFKPNRQHWLHFAPFALFFGYAVWVYAATLVTTDLTEKDQIANRLAFNPIKQAEDILAVLSAILYWVLGVRLVGQYRQWVFNTTSNTDYPTYSWLRQIALLFCLLIVLWATAFLLDAFRLIPSWPFAHWQVFFGYLSGIVYYLGFKGYSLSDTMVVSFDHPKFIEGVLAKRPSGLPTIGLSEEEKAKQEALKERIVEIMSQKKLYLDPELSLQKLADELGSSVSVLSKVINLSFGKSFRLLINEYRVEAVKTMLKNSNSRQFSLVGIGYECGFNSEASFYRIFKSITGMSPKLYAEQEQAGASALS